VAPSSSQIDLRGRIFMGALFLVRVGSFSAVALFAPGPMPWVRYVFLMPFHCAIPKAIRTQPLGLAWFGLWVVGFPVARQWVKKSGRVAPWSEWMSSGSGGAWTGGGSWGGSSDGGSYGSSSSSDSFSGGGGSFGGGGASSSW
jgi:uncharacterized protein